MRTERRRAMELAAAVLTGAWVVCRAAELPPNQWTPMNEPPMGVQLLGWDEIRYVPELAGVLFYGAFRSFTSENQNAIWLYRFNENRWRLVHINLFFNRDELACDGGHTSGRMVYDRSRKVLVHQALVSMGRNDRFRTWVFDPQAMVGWDANPPAPAANIEYDGASVWLPDQKVSFQYRADRGAWAYDATTNRWKQLAPPGRGGPAFTADAVYDARRKRVLAFGGAQGHYGGKSFKTFNDLWAFETVSNTWQRLEAKDPPPVRGWPQMAISPPADVMLLTGGFTGELTPQSAGKWRDDTWVLDLEGLQWKSLPATSPPMGQGYSNHLAYDSANDVFLYLSTPPRHLGYGYQCGVYAFRYEGAAPTRPQRPAIEPAPTYDLASLPKAESEWTPLGGGAVTAVKGWAFRPSLTGTGDRLLLAFGEYDPPGRYQDEGCYVYAFEFAGDKWTRLGSRAVSDPGAHSQCPSAGFDEAGRPVVAYQAIRPWKPTQLLVKRFEGEWKLAGSPAPAKESLPALPSLWAGPGPVAVAWQHHPDYGKGLGAYVAEQAGDTWTPAGDGRPLNVNPVAVGRGQYVSLVRDPQGRLVAAWQEQKADFNGENATPERIHVRRLEEGKWTELARDVPASSPQARALGYALCLHHGEPVVAVCDGTDGGRASLLVYAWDGGKWACLGEPTKPGLNVLGPEGGALKPALVSDGKTVFAAWPEFLPNRPPLLFVKRWDGTGWRLAGGPLNEQPGQGAAHHPALAILKGRPVVAWTEHALEGDTLRRLFVKAMKRD